MFRTVVTRVGSRFPSSGGILHFNCIHPPSTRMVPATFWQLKGDAWQVGAATECVGLTCDSQTLPEKAPLLLHLTLFWDVSPVVHKKCACAMCSCACQVSTGPICSGRRASWTRVAIHQTPATAECLQPEKKKREKHTSTHTHIRSKS